jgi:translation machinery-associated protein 16
MAPSKTGKTAVPKPKKEKVYHPESRKAGQLARNSLRKGKLGNLASKRGKKHNSLGVRYVPSTIFLFII